MNDESKDTTGKRFGMGTLVNHPSFGVGRVIGYEGDSYAIAFKGSEIKQVATYFQGLTPVSMSGDGEMDLLKQALCEVLQDYGWIDADLELASRWVGGTVELKPGKAETSSKTVPIEQFFKKLIGIREKLRVLEQKINNHPSLSTEEKLELEGYITRCYGSVTSFNVLFSDKSRQFKGTSLSDG